MNKYLLAVDGSENALRAVHFLLEKSWVCRSEITLIHVVNYKKEIYKFSPFMDVKEIERHVKEEGEKLLKDRAAVFEKEGIEVNKVLVEGEPGFEIAEYARRGDFDQIVLGTRGLSDLKGLLLGSVSHQVIHFALCPVTLVK